MALDSIMRSAAVLIALGVAVPLGVQSFLTQPLLPAEKNSASVTRGPVPAGAMTVTPVRPQFARTIALRADPLGHFETNAQINGRSISVIVDTGATTVAISSDTARQLGLLPPQSAFVIPISTANGILKGASVMLDEVSVGSVLVRNVQAVVIPGNALGGVSLLGMTFLSRLQRFEIARGELLLTE